jgi:hypothetical protein
MQKTDTVMGINKELPLTKIFWGSQDSPRSVQITLTENYGGQNLGTLTRIFDIARKDFPDASLALNDVNAVVLAGDRRKGMWGIEFKVPKDTVMPEGYKIQHSECILAGGN